MFRIAFPLLVLATWGQAAQAATLYRCVMIDGSERQVTRDLAAISPSAVRDCEVVAEGTGVAPRLIEGHGLTVVLRGGEADAASEYAELVAEAGRRNDLDPRLIDALIAVESGRRTNVRSAKGALGLMQIMPATGARYGVRSPSELLDPSINIHTGARYLGDLHRMYPGRLDLVLAAYNAGEGAVARHGNSIPPYRETIDYVRKVIERYDPGTIIRPRRE